MHVQQLYPLGVLYALRTVPMAMHASLAAVPPRKYGIGTCYMHGCCANGLACMDSSCTHPRVLYALHRRHTNGHKCMHSSCTNPGYCMHYMDAVPIATHACLAAVPTRGYTGSYVPHRCRARVLYAFSNYTGAATMTLHACSAAARGYCMHYAGAVPMAMHEWPAGVSTRVSYVL